MEENRVFYTYRMPFGKVTVAADGSHVLNVALGEVEFPGNNSPTELTNECANELLEYLSGKRSVFEVPISYSGTEFQNQVWGTILGIPYSHVRTYRDIAQAIGQPDSYRMVGQAVNQNPLVILIPAHRVVTSSGHIDSADVHAKLRAAFRDLEQRYA